MSMPVTEELAITLAMNIIKNNPLPPNLERTLNDVPGVDVLCGPDSELDSLIEAPGGKRAHLGDRLHFKAIALYQEAREVGPRSPEFLKLYARAARMAEAASRALAREGATGKHWARVRQDVALGLRLLGDQNQDEAQCVRLLSRAAEVGEEAVKAISERQYPMDWANSRNDLAETLIVLAVNLDDDSQALVHLERAIELCEEALRYRTRLKAPNEWAVSQFQLVDALQKCSCHMDHEKARAMLERAAKIHEETFETLDRKTDSDLWCNAHVLLGRVRKVQGDLESGGKSRRMHTQSVEAFRAASRCISREYQPIRWGRNQLLIAMIQAKIAANSSKDAASRNHSAVVEACESAMEIFDADGFPADWVELHRYLWLALFHLAMSSKGKKSLRLFSRAADACEETIRVDSLRNGPEVSDRMGLATILGELTADVKNDEEAMRHGRRAMEIYEGEMGFIDREGDAMERVELRHRMSDLATLMASRCIGDARMAPLLTKAAECCQEGIRLCAPEMKEKRDGLEQKHRQILGLLSDLANT